MIDDTTIKTVKEVNEIIESVSKKKNIPDSVRASITSKAKRYLKALDGDVDSAIEIFSGLE